jgi:hypothetical protein
MNRQQKPPRPLGLTLALSGSTLVFSLIPLFVVGTIVYLNNRVYASEDGGFVGFNLPGFDISPLIVFSGTAIFFMVMAVVAWKRRHPAMRVVFPLLTVIYAAFWVLSMLPTGTEASVDSMQQAQSGLIDFYLVVVVGTAIYVTWFMNRWSSRAFYRGYYTPEDIKMLDETYGFAKNQPVTSKQG